MTIGDMLEEHWKNIPGRAPPLNADDVAAIVQQAGKEHSRLIGLCAFGKLTDKEADLHNRIFSKLLSIYGEAIILGDLLKRLS